MIEAKVPRALCELVKPAVVSFVHRLVLLTHGRPGSRDSKLEVKTLFETGLVTSLYEYILLSPGFRDYEVRREWKIRDGKMQRPKQIDLWLRLLKGGHPYLIEVGDYTPAKVKHDLNKTHAHNSSATHYFLAFFRECESHAINPFGVIEKSAKRKSNALDTSIVEFDKKYCGTFEVFTAADRVEHFGYALLRRRK